MGVADLGLRNVSGTLVPYTLDTTSVKGSVSFTTAQSAYVDGDGPDSFGVQLNAVATNVTLFGSSTYDFWAQNFVTYTPSSGQLGFGDNVWNFSSLTGAFPSNTFFSNGPNGTLVAPYYYYAVGPTFTVHYPFNVTFYLNSTVVNHRPAIFFNYTLASSAVRASGTFDNVVFNSKANGLGPPAPIPKFEVNGSAYNPTGLLNDFELVVVGNGNGDTTTFFSMQSTLNLDFWNASSTSYAPIPSAYDAGTDTGETSVGIDVSFDATTILFVTTPVATAILRLGPSFLYGLWNVSTNSGTRTFSVSQNPANAFLFINSGTAFKAGGAQWVPTALFNTGPASISVPNGGTYFFEWLLSDYVRAGTSFTVLTAPNNLTTTVVENLTRATGQGVYTPLLAWGNSELPAISASGAGTSASPYVLESSSPSRLASEFAQWNDYEFPVFSGVLLIGTSAWVRAAPPLFAITYPASANSVLTQYGLPSTNDLQLEFWEVSNVSLLSTPSITGWLSSNLAAYPEGMVIFWNSSNNLVDGNTFLDEGVGLALYGGTNNTVWGNSFLSSAATASIPSSVMNAVNNTTGVYESESGDLVYNNFFSVPTPAYSPTQDPFSCQIVCTNATYTDRWNVTLESATVSVTVLGSALTGSIIRTSYQGGNFWSNYGTPPNPYGVLPYNASGLIRTGGDYHPLIPFSLYAVQFNETGLSLPATWGVVALGTTYRSTTANLTVFAPNGTYNYSVVTPPGYQDPSPANFTVDGTSVNETLAFRNLVTLEFDESGLAAGWGWTVVLQPSPPGQPPLTGNSTNGTNAFTVATGSYTYSVSSVGYAARPSHGSVSVTNTTPPVRIAFSLVPVLQVNETGLGPGRAWTVSVEDGSVWSNKTSVGSNVTFFAFDLAPGGYTWTASASNYSAAPSSGSGTSPGANYAATAFTIVNGTLRGTINVPTATLWIDNKIVSITGGNFSVSLAPGVQSIRATAPGYEPYYNNVTTGSGGPTPIAIVMTPTGSGSNGLWGISTFGWVLVAALAAVALALLAVVLVLRRRGGSGVPSATPRARPVPVEPAVPAGAAVTAPAPPARAEPPIWSEDSEAPWKESP